MNLLEALREAGIEFREVGESSHVTEGWIGIICPYCGVGTGKYGLGINLAYLYCSCWKCGSHPLGKVLRDITGEWPRWLKEVERETTPRDKTPGRLVYPEGTMDLMDSNKHVEYLKGRGFDDPGAICRLWQLQAIRMSVRIPWSIVIPVHYHGEAVSWTSRQINENGSRYVSARRTEEKIPAKSLLYGEDLARHAVIICEGPIDCWAIGPGAVATLGVSYTQSQVQKAARFPVRVICFDAQPDAQKRAESLCKQLACFPGSTTNVCLDSGKDPSRASPREIRELRRFLE